MAGVVGVLLRPYWLLQVLALTFFASAVAVDSLRKVEGEWLPEEEQTILRSRVTHYARIAKVDNPARLVESASNAFERALLDRPKWSSLSDKELSGLAGHVPDDAGEAAKSR